MINCYLEIEDCYLIIGPADKLLYAAHPPGAASRYSHKISRYKHILSTPAIVIFQGGVIRPKAGISNASTVFLNILKKWIPEFLSNNHRAKSIVVI